MSSKFCNWYTQALGAILGMAACLYAYLNGFMFVYGNIGRNFDFLSFEEITASYFLYPMCIITLILAFIKSYIQIKNIDNRNFETLNIIIIISTIILGFMGTKMYFIIPMIFLLFSNIKGYILNYNYSSKHPQEVLIKSDKDEDFEASDVKITQKSIDVLSTKKEMAIELLEKKADTQFICEITGLSLDEINELTESKN